MVKKWFCCLAMLASLFLGQAARAQMIPAQPPKCVPPPAPVLNVRVIAPEGVKATFYPNGCRKETLDLPVEVGLRPGYIYRFKLSGVSEDKNIALYPTIQVVGALQLPPPCCAINNPLPLVFRQDEIERALRGAYFTKVYALEHPDHAEPLATKSDDPIQNDVPPDRDLLAEAWARGRPMLIVRLSDRQVPDEVLAANAIAGTMLLPKDCWLPAPDQPPCVPWASVQITDPVLGPRYPEEECFHDGGDTSPPAGFDPQGRLRGLDPSDSVAEYVNARGMKRLAVSNRVCICVPRYVVIRSEIIARTHDQLVSSVPIRQLENRALIRDRMPSVKIHQVEESEVVRNRIQPSTTVEASGPIIIENLLGAGLAIGQIGDRVVVGVCRKQPEPPEAPLVLCKWYDKPCAQIGDTLRFYLRYTNPGGQPINDVVVSDSLTGRLEYIPGSQSTDRDAVFTTQDNEAGSATLRWQIKGTLLPGQSGTVSFEAKIR